MTERPSRRPTRKFARVKEPQVPPAPAVPRFATEERASQSDRASPDSAKPRRIDSHSLTLPSSYVVPKLIVAFDDLSWFDFDEPTQSVLALIDGVRTIAEIAERTARSAGELQLCIADLRERGVLLVE